MPDALSLSVAIVLDSWIVPAWIAEVVQAVASRYGIQAVLFTSGPVPTVPGSPLFTLYRNWDRGRHHPGPDPHLPVDIEEIVKPLTQRPSDSKQTPDVVLWLSEAEPDRNLMEARCGLCFFCHGEKGRHSSVACFAELVTHSPVTSSYFLAWGKGPETAPVKIAEAQTASEIGWSLSRQQQAPLWKASSLALTGLRHIAAGFPASQAQSICLSKGPSAAEVCRFTARNLARTVERRVRYASLEAHWFVAYRTNQEDFVAKKGQFCADGFNVLQAPPGHFYADPFILTQGSRTFLFVEDYLYAEARGVLSVLELQANGQFGPAQQILNRPYHLSYPFVFEHEGEFYMIPETMAARRIELYRAVEMPYRWELVKVLQEDVAAVDTTLWVDRGTFYFFTNLARPGVGPNDLLYLFTADSLTGDWRPHPANPIGLDVRAARGAGKLFWMGDKLVRPSQDCSVVYGYAMQLNQVEVLTPTEFAERPLLRIEPDWAPKLIGTHTINSDGLVEVIDGQIYQTKYRS